MAPRIFMTGASGYIGGQLLETMTAKHPEYEITGLVRTEEQKQKIVERYPGVKILIGDLDSKEIIVEETSKGDVIFQSADCDHVEVLKSIFEGIEEGGKKASFIQVSGAANTFSATNGFGNPTTKIWDDITDLQEISHFQPPIFHAIQDQLVLNSGLKTLVASPPQVYGVSSGIKKDSMGLPWLIEGTEKRGKAFTVGEGKNVSSFIHVKDLADVLVYFAEQALLPENESQIIWGKEAYYFIEERDYVWGDIVDALAKVLKRKGRIASVEVDRLGEEEVNTIHPWGTLAWGNNMRCRGSRLRGLGWVPKQEGIFENLGEIVR